MHDLVEILSCFGVGMHHVADFLGVVLALLALSSGLVSALAAVDRHWQPAFRVEAQAK